MFYRRNLPHWIPDPTLTTSLFVTWRLAGSLPPADRFPCATGTKIAGQAFVAVDRQVDKAAFGPVWLKDACVANVVADALRYGETQRQFYLLRAWVIMPNHVHAVFAPSVHLPVITRWLKGSTARKANQILCRTGKPFWQDESFDHQVRSEAELERIVRYVEQNPVSAGLVARAGDWPWSSARLTGARLTGESACPTLPGA
ncbi:MAG: transposase [Bryobacteraceae bacterium]|jgi:REP element-mobilizing transposase RayT